MTDKQRPFLKWAGNKYRIISEIQSILGQFADSRRLVEPFVGSGAVFLNTDYPEYLLADNNADLIRLYQYLQTEGPEFIHFCHSFFKPENNCKEAYYELRSLFNQSQDTRLRAALFVYFNKHGYNGLCRYNLQGGFNVPFGQYKSPYFPEKEMLYFYQKSQNAVFCVADFIKTFRKARIGDVVYCDPPYVPLSSTASFTTYSQGGFSLVDQQQLATLANKLTAQGIPVLISNHDTPFIREAYNHAVIQELSVQRSISCNGSRRERADEVLALFHSSSSINMATMSR